MIHLSGTYYDGANSTSTAAELEIYSRHDVILKFDDSKRQLTFHDLCAEARLGNTPRVITWGNDDRFVTPDHDAVDELLKELPRKTQLAWVSWLEQRMFVAIIAVIVTVAATGSFAVWGIPFMAQTIAFAAPQSISEQLGESTLSTIDQILQPSQLDEQRKQELVTLFRSHGYLPTIEFRHAKRLGANALTLSSTTVVFTDQLVALAENDEELLAVYLHELGHAEARHVERSILHNSAWVVLLSVILGDASAAGDLILTLPIVFGQAAYSRDFEREADHFAIDGMHAAGLESDALADILERMEASVRRPDISHSTESEQTPEQDQQPNLTTEKRESRSTASKILEYLSTHPATHERVAYIRNAR